MSAAPFTTWPTVGATGVVAPGDDLAVQVLAHLEDQLASARRMRHTVLAQAVAIRRRAVRDVVAAAGELQVEMHRRELIERERGRLVAEAAGRLALPPDAIGFSHLCALLDPEAGDLARAHVVELRDLLVETEREHELNRALMAQELSFLDHLLSLAGGSGSYAADTAGPAAPGAAPARRIRRNPSVRRRVFDLEA